MQLLSQPKCGSGTIFGGGRRTEIKFTEWSSSLKRLRIAAVGLYTQYVTRNCFIAASLVS